MARRTVLWRADSRLRGKNRVSGVDAEILQRLNAERRARRPVMLITDIENGDSRLIGPDDGSGNLPNEEISAAFASGKSRLVQSNGQDLFINVHLPAPRLVIIGAVHISQALAPMAAMAGLDVVVVDPRTAFASDARFEGTSIFPVWPQDYLKDHPLDPFTAMAAVTHDPKIDDPALLSALDTGCFYIGALGSRKTHAARLARLKEAGADETALSHIHAPIGRSIGASSPAEIAVSVLAEIIGALRTAPAGKKGKPDGP